MKNLTCFEVYYKPVYQYLRSAFNLAIENNYTLTLSSLGLVGVFELFAKILKMDLFGVNNYLILFVICTILVDAYYGVKKSKKQSREALDMATDYEEGTPESRKYIKIHELKKFNPAKLQFTFFKCLTLLAYLYFANLLMKSDIGGGLGTVLGYTSAVISKAPLAIFWYYDFKSIGDNSEYVYGKKAPIFKIVESIMEARINKFLKQK